MWRSGIGWQKIDRAVPTPPNAHGAVRRQKRQVKLGQIVNTGRRNETEIKGETALKDFGLFITAEPADVNAPTTTVIGTFIK